MRARQSQRTRPKVAGFRPQLETLEDRTCPSVSFAVEGHTLLVTDDQTDNTVQLRSIGQGQISGTADEVALKDFLHIDKVVVRLGDGSNTLEAKFNAGIALSVDAGNGANTIDVQVAPDDSPAGKKATGEIIAIHTGSGHDTVSVKVADVPDVSVKIDTAGDDDTIRVDVEHSAGGLLTARKVHTAISVRTDDGAVAATLGADGTAEPNTESRYECTVSEGRVMLHSEQTATLRTNDPGAIAAAIDSRQTESVALKLDGRPAVAVNLDQSEDVALKLLYRPAGTLMVRNEESVALKFDYTGATATGYDASQTQSVALRLDNPPREGAGLLVVCGCDVSHTQSVSVKLDNTGTTSASYDGSQTESVAVKSENPGTIAAAIDFLQTGDVAMKFEGRPSATLTLDQTETGTVKIDFARTALTLDQSESVALKIDGSPSTALTLGQTESVMLKHEGGPNPGTEAVLLMITESDAVTYTGGTFLTGAETVALKLEGTDPAALQVILIVVKQQDGTFLTGTEAVALTFWGSDTGLGLFEVSGTSGMGLTESSLSGTAGILAEVAAFGDFQRGASFFEVSGTTRIGLTESSVTGTGGVRAEVAAMFDAFLPGPWTSSFFEISGVGVRGRKADAELQAVVFGDYARLDLPIPRASWPWGD